MFPVHNRPIVARVLYFSRLPSMVGFDASALLIKKADRLFFDHHCDRQEK